jgi:hypothetical protein
VDGTFSGVAHPDMGAYEYDPAITDSDSDGATDLQEHIADTNPTNALSCLRILRADVSRLPIAILYFQSSSNRQYTLFYCTNLAQPTWSPVPGQADIRGNGSVQSLADPNATSTRFYRIGVSIPLAPATALPAARCSATFPVQASPGV